MLSKVRADVVMSDADTLENRIRPLIETVDKVNGKSNSFIPYVVAKMLSRHCDE